MIETQNRTNQTLPHTALPTAHRTWNIGKVPPYPRPARPTSPVLRYACSGLVGPCGLCEAHATPATSGWSRGGAGAEYRRARAAAVVAEYTGTRLAAGAGPVWDTAARCDTECPTFPGSVLAPIVKCSNRHRVSRTSCGAVHDVLCAVQCGIDISSDIQAYETHSTGKSPQH